MQLFAVTVYVAVDTQQTADAIKQSMREYLLEECMSFENNGTTYEFTDGAAHVVQLAIGGEFDEPNVA